MDGFPNFLDEIYGGIKSERLNEITEMPRPVDCEDLAHWATFHLKDQMNQGRFDGMDSVAHLALEICPDLNFAAFYFYYSISQFLHLDFEACIESLHRVMPLVDEDRFQYDQRIYMNLGSAHNNLTNLDSAVYYDDTTSFIQLFDRYAGFLSDQGKNRLEVYKIIWTNYNLNWLSHIFLLRYGNRVD